MYRILCRVILILALVFSAVHSSLQQPHQRSALLPQTTILEIKRVIENDVVAKFDTSVTNPSEFGIKVLDTLSFQGANIALISFKYDNRGFADRTTRCLVCVISVVDETSVQLVGWQKSGYVDEGMLFVLGDKLFAEFIRSYCIFGCDDSYHLLQVAPSFRDSVFHHDLYRHGEIGIESAMYSSNENSYVKLFMDGVDSVLYALVWTRGADVEWESGRIEYTSNHIARYVWDSNNNRLVNWPCESCRDSLKTAFLSLPDPIRFFELVQDTILIPKPGD